MTIKVGIVGVGNCAKSLVEAVARAKQTACAPIGGITSVIGPWHAQDIDFVAAWDIDQRKVNLRLSDAVVAGENCAVPLAESHSFDTRVFAGARLDGVAEHMERAFDPINPSYEGAYHDIVKQMRAAAVEVVVNYLPVGSEQAARFYAAAAVDAGCGFVNCMPVFLTQDPIEREFRRLGLPLIGDDIKSQFGATILHRAIVHLMTSRGLTIKRTYQLNTGGNTDFQNMLERARLESKKRSKTQAVTSMIHHVPLAPEDVHIGPSDHVPWQKDNKIAFIRVEATGLYGAPVDLEMRLSVQDSPNSAGVVMDCIRVARILKDAQVGGATPAACAWYMKSPPKQLPDEEAMEQLSALIYLSCSQK